MGTIATTLATVLVAVLAWFAANFLGQPILALREKRREAIQVAERYSSVSFISSEELRTTALTSFHDVSTALRAYSREGSIATRVLCRLMKYDLETAAQCLFALAEGPRGDYRITEEQRRNTLKALYVSLAATAHLTAAEIDTTRSMIAAAKLEGQRAA